MSYIYTSLYMILKTTIPQGMFKIDFIRWRQLSDKIIILNISEKNVNSLRS